MLQLPLTDSGRKGFKILVWALLPACLPYVTLVTRKLIDRYFHSTHKLLPHVMSSPRLSPSVFNTVKQSKNWRWWSPGNGPMICLFETCYVCDRLHYGVSNSCILLAIWWMQTYILYSVWNFNHRKYVWNIRHCHIVVAMNNIGWTVLDMCL